FYTSIIQNWSRKLKTGGALVFELGEGQAAQVTALMRGQGFADIRTEQDLGGCERAIIGIWQSTVR
ncbi:MAG: peptide chain release factor N(5)-glutamine methyltransferase, partial [Ruminococcus sp.]|nr:peptide chain release factor N(5)-glutamine methyltransferase [Ruminococcus sp.]